MGSLLEPHILGFSPSLHCCDIIYHVVLYSRASWELVVGPVPWSGFRIYLSKYGDLIGVFLKRQHKASGCHLFVMGFNGSPINKIPHQFLNKQTTAKSLDGKQVAQWTLTVAYTTHQSLSRSRYRPGLAPWGFPLASSSSIPSEPPERTSVHTSTTRSFFCFWTLYRWNHMVYTLPSLCENHPHCCISLFFDRKKSTELLCYSFIQQLLKFWAVSSFQIWVLWVKLPYACLVFCESAV